MNKSKQLGYGVYIGVNDVNGQPIHIGDHLQFDEKEYGEPCEFVVELFEGELHYCGAASDLSNYCTIIQNVNN